MQSIYFAWKHGELSDREFYDRIDRELRINNSQVEMAAVAHRDKNLARVADELQEITAILHRVFEINRRPSYAKS
jgi:hypothetical protein